MGILIDAFVNFFEFCLISLFVFGLACAFIFFKQNSSLAIIGAAYMIYIAIYKLREI
jgi:threonine/homoserine/homoserine lactone efflux protein